MDDEIDGENISELRVLRTKANLLGFYAFQTSREQEYGADENGYAEGWALDGESTGKKMNFIIIEFDQHITGSFNDWALFLTEAEAIRAFLDYLKGKDIQDEQHRFTGRARR